MPITSITDARDEILDHFTTAWNAQTPPVPLLLYGDKHTDLPDDAPFARITVVHGPSEQVSVGGETGNRRFRRFGVITVQIFALAGDGLSSADSFAKIALDAFEGDKTGLDRVTFRNVRINEVGEDGPWMQVNVLADFDWDTVK
jgi:hypothetical protein